MVENTLGSAVNFRIFDLNGRVVYTREVGPGQNEIKFLGTGIFLMRFSGQGVEQHYKALF
jgi:hypothetical protein